MKAWLYYRLSHDEDKEQNSLQNQRQILENYAKQNGHEIVGESFNDNVSGMTLTAKVSEIWRTLSMRERSNWFW